MILIAEDNASQAERMVKAILSHPALQDIQIKTAQTEHETFMLCRDRLPDLLIADLQLRGSSGMSFLATLRAMFPKLPIMPYSVLLDPLESTRLISSGVAINALSKPSPAEYEEIADAHFADEVAKAFAQIEARRLSSTNPTTNAPTDLGFWQALNRHETRIEILELRYGALDERLDSIEATIKQSTQALSTQMTELMKARWSIVDRILTVAGTIIGLIVAAWAASRWGKP